LLTPRDPTALRRAAERREISKATFLVLGRFRDISEIFWVSLRTWAATAPYQPIAVPI
jgi:hypothetical protein